MERKATILRTTEQAEVRIVLDLDGAGIHTVETEAPFLDRMLSVFARHGGFDLDVQCRAGAAALSEIMDEVGFCLGLAFCKALGSKTDTVRFGQCCAPVDDRLARVVVEETGHPRLVYRVPSSVAGPEGADAADVERFWHAFTGQSHLNMHIELLYGSGGLPAFEAIFKAAARALREACGTQEPHSGRPKTPATAIRPARKLR